jgi:hypothetical protein
LRPAAREADGTQALVRRSGQRPVALDLVDPHEVGKRHGRLAAARRKLLEELLGTVIQSRAKVVACQLGECRIAVRSSRLVRATMF